MRTAAPEEADLMLVFARIGSENVNEWYRSLTVLVSLSLLLRLPRLGRFWGVGLQLFQLLHEEGQVLQQVSVLQQQLVDAGLSFHTGRGLRRHLIFQQLHLY